MVGAAASATLGARGVFLCEVFAPLAWPERGFSEQRAIDGEQELAIGISLLAGLMIVTPAAVSSGRLEVRSSYDPIQKPVTRRARIRIDLYVRALSNREFSCFPCTAR